MYCDNELDCDRYNSDMNSVFDIAGIGDLVACEQNRFSVNDYRGLPDAPEYEFVRGSVPVLVSAPHAVTHIRAGRIKPSEDYTGAIALAVAQTAECHAIVAARTGEGDPNWDDFPDSPYKQALCDYVRNQGIRLVIDVHGMVAASPALLAVGSADGETVEAARKDAGFDSSAAELLRDRLATWCELHDKPVVLNGHYGARHPNTVSRTVARECGVAALQIEAATQLRVPVLRAGRVPKGERIPFSSEQLPVELAVRRRPDPDAVVALVNALCELALSA